MADAPRIEPPESSNCGADVRGDDWGRVAIRARLEVPRNTKRGQTAIRQTESLFAVHPDWGCPFRAESPRFFRGPAQPRKTWECREPLRPAPTTKHPRGGASGRSRCRQL